MAKFINQCSQDLGNMYLSDFFKFLLNKVLGGDYKNVMLSSKIFMLACFVTENNKYLF